MLSGVDTLVRTFLAPVPASTLERLELARRESEQRRELEQAEHAEVRIAARAWSVAPHGAPPYRYLLHVADVMDVRIAGKPVLAAGTPTVVIEIRSAYLWHRGWAQAAEDARELARELLGAPAECAESLARIDLCADFQGWQPDGSDAETERFARRTRTGWTRHGEGAGFTGYSISPGSPLSARLYDKTREIEATDKGWFHDLWRDRGYDAERPVWRLEIQARGEALAEFGLRESWDGSVVDRLDELWGYAVGRWDWHPEQETPTERELRALRQRARRLAKAGAELPPDDQVLLAALELEHADQSRDHGAWLSLRDPVCGRPRGAWPIAAAWRELQAVTFTDHGARRGLRERQRQARVDNCLRQIRGLLSTVAACYRLEPSRVPDKREALARTLSRAFSLAHSRMCELDEGEQRDFVALLEEKRPRVAATDGEEAPEPKRLPEAPWTPDPDGRRTLPFQLPSMLELRELPRAAPPAPAELPHKPWHGEPSPQLELSAADLEYHRRLAALDAAEDRRLSRRLRFEAAPVLKRLPKRVAG